MSRTILIVDDNAINRQMLCNIVSTEYSVMEAKNGQEAMTLLSRDYQNISAVLLDIMMPVMDGYEVLEEVRSNPVLEQIPIIVTTGSSQLETEKKALTLGANDFVQKPFDPDILKRRLQNLISLRETSAIVKNDRLTGLFNREAFFEAAEEMMLANPDTNFVLACMDVDNFKVINEQYGNEKGDEVLRALASAIANFCAVNSCVCGRISADNFVTLRTGSFAQQSDSMPDVLASLVFEKTGINIILSIGRYAVDDRSLSVSAMYDRAKIAQKSIKGHSNIHIAMFDDSMLSGILRKQKIISEMHSALASGQFEAWYQPQYNHATNAMIGAEALVRWRHPEQGLISPGVFIPIFEQNGFIYNLDKYVWEDVCRHLRKWLDEGRNPLPVSVNISRFDIIQPDLVEIITDLIKKYSLPVELLRLEVTESAFSENADRIIKVVKQLISLGFTLEIDDFGSGFSSLNTLKDVPAQIIKLDMKFFDQGDDTQRGGNIISSVVRMAMWLGMSVIAEGVEEKEDADFLRSIGCYYIQGYLYAKPMSVDKYEYFCKGNTKEEHLLALEIVENLNNNSFWDPGSIDTIIFNNYVGGACIFEYHDGISELLRVNRKYAQELGGADMTEEAALQLELPKYTDEHNLQIMNDCIRTASETDEESTCEVSFVGLREDQPITYIRYVLRVIARTATRKLIYCTVLNITEQRVAELRFTNVAEQMNVIMENINSGISAVTTDDSGRIHFIYANDQYYEMLGYTKEQFDSEVENGLDLVLVEDRARINEIIQRMIACQGTDVYDFRCIKRDGSVMYLRCNAACTTMKGIDGAVLLSVSMDISEQKKHELELIEKTEQIQALNNRIVSEAKVLSEVMNDAPGAFARMRLLTNGKLSTIFVNDTLCELRQMTREEILSADNKDATLAIHPDDYEMVNSTLRCILETGERKQLTYRIRRADGSYIPQKMYARVTKDDDNNTYINVYYTDLTEQEKFDYSLREMTPVVLSAIMQSSPNLDFAKDKEFKYICCSPGFVKFTRQKSEADVVGKTDYDIWAKEEADHFRSDDVRLFESGESLIDYTEMIPSDDGRPHYAVTSKYILRDSKGEIIGLYGTARDVTDTRASLEQLNLLTNSIPGGIARYAISSSGYETVYFNDGFCKILGCTREECEEMLKAGVTMRVFPEDLPELQRQIGEMYDHGTSIDCTFRNNRADGNDFLWINMRGELSERSGDICYVNAVLFDVTEQKEAERRAHDASEEFSTIIQNLRSGLTVTTLGNGRINYILANTRYYEMLGYTKEQFEAEVNDAITLIHKDDRAQVLSQVNRIMLTREPGRYEYRVRKRDGSIGYVRCYASIVSLPSIDGDVLVSVSLDISEIVQAQLEERQIYQRMNFILENASSGIRTMVVDGDKTNILYANNAFYDVLGYTRAQYEAEVTDRFNVVHPDDREWVEKEMAAIKNVGDRKTFDFRIVTRGGEVRWVRVGIIVTSFEGIDKPVQLNVHTDITAEKEQDELRRNLLDNLPCGCGVFEFDGEKLSAIFLNQQYWELVEKQKTDYTSDDFLSIVHPDDLPILFETISKMVYSQQNMGCDIRINFGVKSYQPYHIEGHPVPQKNGKYQIFAIYTPLDPKAMSYREMMPHILSAITESTSDYTFAKDAQFRYLACSSAFLRLLGLTDESEVLGKTDYDLFPQDLADQFRKNDLALAKSGKSMVDFDETIRDENGATRYCKASKYILHDTVGEVIGLYGISHDITNEKTMQSQLELINNNVPGGIATYAISPRGMEIVYYNDGFCRVLGYTKEEYDVLSKTSVVSRVYPEDMPGLMAQVKAMYEHGTPINYSYRTRGASENGCIWINLRGELAERIGDVCYLNAILIDITQQQATLERLRISEEENLLAVEQSGSLVCRYNIAEKTLSMTPEQATKMALPDTLTDVPETPIRFGMISPDTVDAYRGFFLSIHRGDKAAIVLYQQQYFGSWQWTEAKSTTIFSDDGQPIKAIISMSIVTERVEKEAVYKRWQQSMADRAPETFSLFRCNLNSGDAYASREGTLITFGVNEPNCSFADRIRDYSQQMVYADDRDKVTAFINADTMLASYYRGKRADTLEYRELTNDNSYRWIMLTVELVESPNSTDVEAYMMFENVNAEKRAELETRRLAETDPLTGILNRAAFTAKVSRILQNAKPQDKFALLMLDIDGFKRVNDVFGHGAGDQTLIDIAEGLSSIVRSDDYVSRLGGDEFMVFMNGISNIQAAKDKAAQICSICRKAFSREVQISASVGIVFAPHDGMVFNELYKKVDSALYYVKGSGKDSIAVYSDTMADEHMKSESDSDIQSGQKPRGKKQRMLVVDDNKIQLALLEKAFKEDFIIDTAKDGNSALIRLRHYENAISVMLLDLMMPGMDGFDVLRVMQQSENMRSIPVIIVSGDESRETCLKAVREGATDFVTKPVDIEVLKIRVHSAVSKAENERLRAKNSLLEFQNSENAKGRQYLESPGITFIDYNCESDAFDYYPSVSRYLLGNYDGRGLWNILLSDEAADSETVKGMQMFVHRITSDRDLTEGSLIVKLKTPGKAIHRFRMSVRKPIANKLTDCLVICLIDLDYVE